MDKKTKKISIDNIIYGGLAFLIMFDLFMINYYFTSPDDIVYFFNNPIYHFGFFGVLTISIPLAMNIFIEQDNLIFSFIHGIIRWVIIDIIIVLPYYSIEKIWSLTMIIELFIMMGGYVFSYLILNKQYRVFTCWFTWAMIFAMILGFYYAMYGFVNNYCNQIMMFTGMC